MRVFIFQKYFIMYKSIIEYFADKSASQCGYCRSTNGSYSNGMWGHVMTCQDYQGKLIVTDKVHIFWEGHTILRNLHITFDCIYWSQK